MAMYAYLDGDDIGLRIENGLLTNNETILRKINVEVNSIVCELSEFLVGSDHEIIFCGADGIICKGEQIGIDMIHSFLYRTKSSIRFSIGIGRSLSDAFSALRFAKANGKNGTAVLNERFEWIERT